MDDAAPRFERRQVDVHIANLERDVAVIRQTVADLSDRVYDVKRASEKAMDGIDRLQRDATDPALTAAGRLLIERSVNNARRLDEVEPIVEDLVRWRDSVTAGLGALRGVFGVSLLGAALSVVAFWKAFNP